MFLLSFSDAEHVHEHHFYRQVVNSNLPDLILEYNHKIQQQIMSHKLVMLPFAQLKIPVDQLNISEPGVMTNTKGISSRNDYMFVQLHKFNNKNRTVKNFLH